jgi:CoA-disulfide reductase
MKKVIIVGGVAGGASAAARLRRLDETANIIMFEKGEFISFANCGLPYYIGGEIKDKAALTLQTPEGFHQRFNVDVRTMQEVIKVDKHKKIVTVKDLKNGIQYEETYDKLILSPGAVPRKLSIIGGNHNKVFTLRNIPDTLKIKEFIQNEKVKSAVIVGGGYIGIEMAENLYLAGLDVTIVEYSDHVIGSLDSEMASDVHNHLREKGIKLMLNNGVKEIYEHGNEIKLILDKGEVLTDMVIMSVGVTPDSKLASEVNLEVNNRGAIVVDSNMQTSDKDIYAIGDAIQITDFITSMNDMIPLAGPANKQGRIVADNIAGIPSTYNGTQGTGILKSFDMTIAMTGISENKAKKLGIDYMKSYSYSQSHATYYPGAEGMSLKIIFERETGKLLGAQIVGFDGVDKRIDVLATAIRGNMTIYDLTRLELAYAPPYSSAKDPVNMAGFIAENMMNGLVKVFYPEDVDRIRNDKNAILLDIRSEEEFEYGSIEGFTNISLDELRKNINVLDKNKKVYVICQIGLRGYIASRILTSHGFDCYNLSGGYRLYDSINRDKLYEDKNDENILSVASLL